MRYKVGEKIVAVNVDFKRTDTGVFLPKIYMPWLGDKLNAIHTRVLTVEHHEKVAWCQDPDGEKKYDGYILRDAEGAEWHNQYPRASYGQLDDSKNYQFNNKADEDFLTWTDGVTTLENIARGIRHFLKENKPEEEHIIEALKNHFDEVRLSIRSASGMEVKTVFAFPKEEDTSKIPDPFKDIVSFELVPIGGEKAWVLTVNEKQLTVSEVFNAVESPWFSLFASQGTQKVNDPWTFFFEMGGYITFPFMKERNHLLGCGFKTKEEAEEARQKYLTGELKVFDKSMVAVVSKINPYGRSHVAKVFREPGAGHDFIMTQMNTDNGAQEKFSYYLSLDVYGTLYAHAQYASHTIELVQIEG